MKKVLLLLSLLFSLFVVSNVSAQSVQFTANDGTECAPALLSVEPQCYYPIIGFNASGQLRWLTYNTTAGTVSIIEIMNAAPYEQIDRAFTGLAVTLTPVLSYSTPAGPGYGQWATKISYQEMKGTFNGGTLDLIFETVGQFKPVNRYLKAWVYKILVVNAVVDQTGTTVSGYGPSTVSY